MFKTAIALIIALGSVSPVFAKDAIEKALKDRIGKPATVVLRSGESLTGKVDRVGDGALRLNELAGKEFYDAIIDLDSIDAVELRRP